MDPAIGDHFSQVLTFLATVAGIIGGTVRSFNRAEVQRVQNVADFYKKEFDAVNERWQTSLTREDKQREELGELRNEVMVLHREFGTALQMRMSRGKRLDACSIEVNGKNVIIDASENVALFTGYTPSELLGKDLGMLIPTHYRDDHEKKLRLAASISKKVIRWDSDIGARLTILNKDGTERAVTIALVGGGSGAEAKYTAMIRFRSTGDSHFPS